MIDMAKLEVKNLTISFRTNNGAVRAVRDISFDLHEGETLAIAGESGSGKSVTTRAVMGILAGNAMVDAGEIIYDGRDLLKIPEEEFHTLRGHKLAMVFQDPLSALNPIMRIGKQLTEAMLLNNKERRRDGKTQFNKMLRQLEEQMVEACKAEGESGDVKARIHESVRAFDSFVSLAVKEEYSYKEATESIVEAADCIDECQDALLKRSEKDVRDACGRLNRAMKHIFNPYTFDANDGDIVRFAQSLSTFHQHYTNRQQPEMEALLDEVKAKLDTVLKGPTPNFFCIGYCLQHGYTPDPKRQTIAEINAQARKTLDDGFMLAFLKDVEKALRYSENQSVRMKEEAVATLKKALPVFRQNPLDEGKCKEAMRASAAAVEASIDKLLLDKDNMAYVYRSGVASYINRYFRSLTYNPKEEKRFTRETARFEKDTATGKNVAAVVPMNLIDTQAAQDNLSGMVEKLIAHFEEQMADQSNTDYEARGVEMVDYLKARAEDYAFRLTKGMARHRAIELMKEVGIPEPHKRYRQYPFEFSGGMRQRIVIAIALSANPDILICDEPTTALDVTIQAQILELINRLKAERRLSVIFITHDLGVVANMADRIAIMYAGKIVEYGTADDVFYDPRHPYTWALLSSMPDLETKEKLEAIPGTPPDMIVPPKGDAFAPRNKYAMQIDFEEQPPMFRISETHSAATWLLHPDAPKVEPPAIVTDRIRRMQKEQAEHEAQERMMKGGAEA